MAGEHAARAEELAEQAAAAMEKADQQRGEKLSALVEATYGDRGSYEQATWARVAALQAQAQIHATLAVAEQLNAGGRGADE